MTPLAFGLTDNGIRLMSQGNYDFALNQFSMAIEVDSNYREAYYNRGLTYLMLNKYPNAIVDFKSALRIDPDYFESYRGLGDAYYELGQSRLALRNYESYLEIAGESTNQVIINRVEELRGD